MGSLKPLSLAMVGTAFLVIGAAAYIYMSIRYKDSDAAFDFWDENIEDY
ncbi:MAG: hypothetical protein LPK14_04540 [Hymenobacteraceae bacterium]|nr:hypothetical protein [Hymenobacteraceae bacterium]MDX5421499.1 hypothetical protein [Hymenobacteraceae bacterium]